MPHLSSRDAVNALIVKTIRCVALWRETIDRIGSEKPCKSMVTDALKDTTEVFIKTANLQARIAQESRRLKLFSDNWTYWLGEEVFVRATMTLKSLVQSNTLMKHRKTPLGRRRQLNQQQTAVPGDSNKTRLHHPSTRSKIRSPITVPHHHSAHTNRSLCHIEPNSALQPILTLHHQIEPEPSGNSLFPC
ncbi:hypothetical protein KC355_g9 [Hortaea werneckii]|nr:hypothetical protein KC355_g9 [Hortaea werneckii]